MQRDGKRMANLPARQSVHLERHLQNERGKDTRARGGKPENHHQTARAGADASDELGVRCASIAYPWVVCYINAN